ncbi:MAG TPA: DUF3054 family protein [Anaerolineales bacterium]|nr:DUF3054 family protein [Anaerolineales bacterium]
MKKYILPLGDGLTLLIVTLIGFTTHGEFDIFFLPRMAATYIPLLIAWFLIARWLGLLTTTLPPPHPEGILGRWRAEGPLFFTEATEGARAGLAMLFAGPLAVVLRGLLLNAPIIPIFAVVLSLTSALGLMIWRTVYLLLKRRLFERD